MEIRRQRSEDIERADELFNRCYPTYGANEEVNEYNREHEPLDRFRQSFVGVLDDRVIASLNITSLGETPDSGEFFLTFIVDPDYRGRGYGSELHSLGDRYVGYLNWKEVYTWCDSADTNTVTWLERLGYTEAGRAVESILDLAAYRKPDDYSDVLNRIEEQGIIVKAFGDIDDTDKLRKFWELNEATNADIPDPFPYEKRSFKKWREKMAAPNCLMDTIHVAIDGDKFVAHTKLYFNYGPGKHAITGATGTLRSHRNRGIAKALKYRMIDWAVANGVPSISTDNAEQNEYILRINRKLGFKPISTWLDLVKKRKSGD